MGVTEQDITDIVSVPNEGQTEPIRKLCWQVFDGMNGKIRVPLHHGVFKFFDEQAFCRQSPSFSGALKFACQRASALSRVAIVISFIPDYRR